MTNWEAVQEVLALPPAPADTMRGKDTVPAERGREREKKENSEPSHLPEPNVCLQ